MTKTDSFSALFELCCADLGAGAAALRTRLVEVIHHAENSGLIRSLQELEYEAERRAVCYCRISNERRAPENLWMKGILDDAERDTRTLPQGPILDIAIIGAIRKALNAELASIETALAVNRALETRCGLAELSECRDDNVKRDADLRSLLHVLTGSDRID